MKAVYIFGLGFFLGWAWGVLIACRALADCKKGGEKDVRSQVDKDRH